MRRHLVDEGVGMDERIAVIGLGYVGLPVALAFARHFEDVVGFDIDADKVAELQRWNRPHRRGRVRGVGLSSLRLDARPPMT